MSAKVCLVTGASSGIGQATARELLRAGHVVYGAARRAHLMGALREAGGHALPMDVTKEEDLHRVVRTIVDAHGRIDVLVNNAGTVVHGAIEDTPLAMAREVFEVNVFGPARLTQLVLPLMRHRRSGTIVNVSSIGGELALPLGAWYYASKHAQEAFSDTLRMEVAPFGIDVVVIQPGIIRTGFEAGSARQLREISGQGPYHRMAEAMAQAAEAAMNDPDSPASDPGVVAATIVEAVESDRPETRYVVGWQAEALLNLHRTLPDRDFDAAVTAHHPARSTS
ncbi:short chain dehydrogenase [[Actinomadura] parvosata subsp. kistnae]|uniref:Short-chain dehydrogenase/reductase n=1 Tax=[Actinomadura] parvosata subsp. kistnae TaxID=1909395 RepID=A0A1U9ZUW8_9ACTN|nr:oxidoreductase [Nonomuraea sp. ATCC 55076]AQZ61751.1 short-chain dehydrogenase/reductase [Nonomuraea sp. ATCC 55076]SPL87867.1 short chain dehydrogenase [Actinomadura parvosata subsp. kistnae]